MKVVSGRSHPALARDICEYLGVPLGRTESFKFKNDNSFVRILESVRQMDCYVVQPSCFPVNDNLVELLLMLDALLRASARSITVVMPYYAYGRSDKKDQPRIPITASLMARLLETAGASRVLTMDLHAEQIQGFFRIPVDQLLAAPVICRYIQQKAIGDLVAVAPDAGSTRRTAEYARLLAIPMAILDKRRTSNDDRAHVVSLSGDVKGKNTILFDDEISTAGTLVSAVEVLKNAGAQKVYAGVTHPVLCGDALERIERSGLEELVVTNTLPLPPGRVSTKIKVLSVAPLLASAIYRIHHGHSLNALFSDEWETIFPAASSPRAPGTQAFEGTLPGRLSPP
ncbi:MAG: ribose-phosphate pyrophosphokinase [Candidatus Riflebacteria bacterium]|nr:ribose-phosphate pyrophosphokinase [Candidatus Riflebacteria bacterium]